ncbi:Tad domain-containing protein [Aurantiacibacter sp. D1-12]|uniref:Tad domain-containing protein n=1 Tax=Aurantiacibacter sp. D1-12 TaxID=2993658 RepID=UPI00237C6558|nr:pilus assembly protein TadG-related protein [Aurantiacibacter sp. D1-12]MDE1466665.1 pilus assembly protein TadG-related protein [Aurantiacibacter sp. D1-12]
MAMIAASIFPLIALVGGGVDMGRGYLAKTRLQAACDAGTLAARNRMGNQAAVDGTMPSDVAETGHRFFDLNFRDGAYGTENRNFSMQLEGDFSIRASASVDVPTTLMSVFGFDEMEVTVDCSSIQTFPNLDVMMALDVTGSMRHTNAGDSQSRLESLKSVIRTFYTTLDASKGPATTIRYGFVPYNANVNVGHLLQDSWVVDSWTYQGRRDTGLALPGEDISYTYYRNWQYVSGTRTDWTAESTYAATWNESPNPDQPGWYSCEGAQPSNTWDTTTTIDDDSARTEVQFNPPAIVTIKDGEKVHNGTRYQTVLNGDTCEIQASTDTNYIQTFEEVTVLPSLDHTLWSYEPISRDVSNWRTETDGCIEERGTYIIDDYDNVDFSRALDLDIDLVPSSGNSATQWRPRYTDNSYARSLDTSGTGDFTPRNIRTTAEFANSGTWWSSDCPPAAAKLTAMTSDELNTYLDTLVPYGSTHHDIGMIWGGRLLSPTGLYASENSSGPDDTRGRHLIWLTDGQTEPYDISYSSYGIEGLDQRRWDPDGTETLTSVVENRFRIACQQVKNRNITVWVVAFGTSLNPIMEECGGPGRTFQANNAEELNQAFMDIASSMSELRLSS